jgi:nicotinamidase-related amidase
MPDIAADHHRTFRCDPAHTALICIDMQRDFLDPGGYAAAGGEDVGLVRGIIPRAQAVLDAARNLGMTIVHTREGHRPDLCDLSAAKAERSAASGNPIGAPGPMGRLLIRGEYGHDLIDEMQARSGEAVVDKPGFGAFYQTDLDLLLGNAGITHLWILGVTTQCCVFSTLREAVDRGYSCLTLRDCCGAFDDHLHQGTLAMIASEGHLFGWVSDSERLLAATA